MAKRQAIRNEGKPAEQAFLRLVPGSRPSDIAKLGDVVVALDCAEHYVEVKHCDSVGESINQVRAIKFIPCVIYAPRRNSWYILSPDQLVRLAATKSRGHHNEIPFECMNFTLGSLSDDFHSKATDAELATKLHAAIRRGAAASNLQELMTSLLQEISTVKSRYIDAVRRADSQ